MKKHLEYKDEKSQKFWEITLEENKFTTRYGKIGTEGISKTKEFDTKEKAKIELEKLVKQKLKKGYLEPALDYKLLSIEDAKTTYKLDYEIIDSMDSGYSIITFEEDVFIDGDFNNWFKAYKDIKHSFILFTKNLSVNGNVHIDCSNEVQLVVLGNFSCDFFYVNDYLYNLIVGNATIKYAISCNYNDAYTNIIRETIVPFYFNSDNASTINTTNTITFGTGMADDEDFEMNETLSKIIKPKFLEIDDSDEDVYLEDFDINLFVETIKKGKSPFINIEDKDFTLNFNKKDLLKKIRIKEGKKITSYTIKSQDDVADVLEMSFLKNLTIKDAITFPDELINKPTLEKLTISTEFVKKEDIAKAVGRFSQIKELNIKDSFYRWKFKLEKATPLLFKKLNNLKKLSIEGVNNETFQLLPNLESLYLTVGDSSHISGKHKLLKKLVIHKSRGEFKNIHQFPNLEEFQLLEGFYINEMLEPLHLEKLKKLTLSYSYISDNIKQYYTCTHLEYLSLTNEFSASKRNDIIGIGKLKNLTHLSLKIDLTSSYGRTTAIKGFNEQNIKEIASLKNLKTLDLSGSLTSINKFKHLNSELPNSNITATIEQYSKNGKKTELTIIKSNQTFSVTIFEENKELEIKKCTSIEDAFEKINKLKLKLTSNAWGKSVFLYNNDLGKYHLEYSVRITLTNNKLNFIYYYRDNDNVQIEKKSSKIFNNYNEAEKAYKKFVNEKVKQGYEM